MADTQLPSFDDLEPEGADVEPSGGLEASFEAFEDRDSDGFQMGALGEYEFEDSEEDDDPQDNGFSEPRRSRKAPRTSIRRIARTAFTWGNRATTTSVLSAKGQRRVAPEAAQEPMELSEELLRSEDDVLASRPARSAALAEEVELMKTLANAAMTTENAVEAAGLAAAMAPLSIRLAPNVYRSLWPAIPVLVQGGIGLTRLLHSQSATRPLIRLIPAILENTTAQLARHAARGRAITRRGTAKVLARQTALILQRQRRSWHGSRRSLRSKSRAQRLPDPFSAEEWWDNGYGA